VKNNILWHKELRYIVFTAHNIVVVEDLNQEKTQRLLKEGNDKIYDVKFSPDQRMILAFTREGSYDGFPSIFIWDAATFKKLNQIAVNDQTLDVVEFSPNSNMLLTISKPAEGGRSNISVWDFLDGNRDTFCKSGVLEDLIEARWNTESKDTSEFVTIGAQKYFYWRISPSLALQY